MKKIVYFIEFILIKVLFIFNLSLITTEKDFFRLSKLERKNIKFLKIKLEIKNIKNLKKILITKL